MFMFFSAWGGKHHWCPALLAVWRGRFCWCWKRATEPPQTPNKTLKFLSFLQQKESCKGKTLRGVFLWSDIIQVLLQFQGCGEMKNSKWACSESQTATVEFIILFCCPAHNNSLFFLDEPRKSESFGSLAGHRRAGPLPKNPLHTLPNTCSCGASAHYSLSGRPRRRGWRWPRQVYIYGLFIYVGCRSWRMWSQEVWSSLVKL